MVFRIPLYLVFCFFVFASSNFLYAQTFEQEYISGSQSEPDYTSPAPQVSQPTVQPSASGGGDPASSAIGPAWSSPSSLVPSRSPSTPPRSRTTSASQSQLGQTQQSCAGQGGTWTCGPDGCECFGGNVGNNPAQAQSQANTNNSSAECYPTKELCESAGCPSPKTCQEDPPGAWTCKEGSGEGNPLADTGTAPEKCEKALDDVSSVCKLDNNSDIQQIMQVSKQFSSGMANNAVTACTDIGKLASSANLAMFGFESKCQAEYKDCDSACSEKDPENQTEIKRLGANAGSFKDMLRQKRIQCKKYSEQVKPSELDAQRAMQSQVTNSCDNLLAKLGMDCLRNPSGPGCSSLKINPGDCKNPANISNQVCLCINNPAACSNLSKGLANLPGGNGGIEGDGGGTGPGGIGAGLPGGALSLGDDMIGLEGKGGFSGVNTGAGGGRGGGGYGSGDSASGGRGKPGLAMKTGPETNIYKGNYGGGAAFGGPGGSGGGAGYRDQNGQAVPKGSVVDKNGRIRPDFSKFYPNMKYDPGRGLAGVSGPDGITGPATNLFNKVNNQFRSQAKTFLP